MHLFLVLTNPISIKGAIDFLGRFFSVVGSYWRTNGYYWAIFNFISNIIRKFITGLFLELDCLARNCLHCPL